MSLRTCEVWAVANDPEIRTFDHIYYGHSVHRCVRLREFCQEHEGDHECRCGFTYPKGPTDNDPTEPPILEEGFIDPDE